MDSSNENYLRRLFGLKHLDKIHYLMDYAGEHRDVSDPWYTGDFDKAYADILAGCRGILKTLNR